MVKSKKISFLISSVFILLLILLGCEVEQTPQTESGIAEVVDLEEARISVQNVRLRNHLQIYYLMRYPPPGNVFLAVTLAIDNLAASPDVILDWGKQNFYLECAGIHPEFAFARREIVNEDVLYKSGEDLDFDYVYIFNVSQKTDFDACSLVFSNGQRLNLTSIAQPSDFVTGVTDDLGIVLGGSKNQAHGLDATVAGGSRNIASAVHTVVSGGDLNAATASHATVGGGRENTASNFYATISGGYANTASARDTFVGGGSRNTAGEARSTVGGGLQNQALAPDSVIAGGAYNQVGDDYAAIIGGTRNTANGYASVIGGGAGNQVRNDQAAVVGGLNNQVEGKYGFIGGGYGNLALGNYAAIPGGFQNQAAGDYSFAAGNRAQVSANHVGTFLFADGSEADFLSVTRNEFAVRATGGVRFVTAVNTEGEVISGIQLLPGSGAWSTLSDKNLKMDMVAVEPQVILKAVSELPISTWRYQAQAESVRHIGPMAQDFYAAFGLGEDSRYISTVDADGVTLAAIQGLYQLAHNQAVQIEAQQSYLIDLESRLQVLEQNNNSQQKSPPNYWSWLGWVFLSGWGIWSQRRRLMITIQGYPNVNHDHGQSPHRDVQDQ